MGCGLGMCSKLCFVFVGGCASACGCVRRSHHLSFVGGEERALFADTVPPRKPGSPALISSGFMRVIYVDPGGSGVVISSLPALAHVFHVTTEDAEYKRK